MTGIYYINQEPNNGWLWNCHWVTHSHTELNSNLFQYDSSQKNASLTDLKKSLAKNAGVGVQCILSDHVGTCTKYREVFGFNQKATQD